MAMRLLTIFGYDGAKVCPWKTHRRESEHSIVNSKKIPHLIIIPLPLLKKIR
jgi:hypothetical protein